MSHALYLDLLDGEQVGEIHPKPTADKQHHKGEGTDELEHMGAVLPLDPPLAILEIR